MSRIVFLEYTKDLIKKEQPDLNEEEITSLARNLVDQARTEVNKREKERNKKAIDRGIDLTRNRVVSKEVYSWYTNLSPAEHQVEFGFERNEANNKHQAEMNCSRVVSRIPETNIPSKGYSKKVPTQLRDNQMQKQNVESQRIMLSNQTMGLGSRSREAPRFARDRLFSKQYQGKENQQPNWSKNGSYSDSRNCTWRQDGFTSYAVKRKTDDIFHMSVKRQKVY